LGARIFERVQEHLQERRVRIGTAVASSHSISGFAPVSLLPFVSQLLTMRSNRKPYVVALEPYSPKRIHRSSICRMQIHTPAEFHPLVKMGIRVSFPG
jgi:hypothetical protein